MKKEEFLDRLENLDEDLILEGEMKMKNNKNKKWLAPLIACSLVVVAVGGKYFVDRNKNIIVDPPLVIDQIPAATSEAYPRRFFFYDGSMYAFIDQAEGDKFNNLKLGKELAELKFDLEKEGENYEQKELLTSFLVGEKIYEIEGYSPKFRVAAKSDGNIYVAEKVNNMFDKEVNLKEYFEVAELAKNTESISIKDHMGFEELKKLDKKDSEKLIEDLEKSKQHQSTYKEFEKVGSYQADGKSFKLVFNFKDGINFEMYIIPELDRISVGDNEYKLDEEVKGEIVKLFEGLKQEKLIP